MWHELLGDARFQGSLLEADRELAAEVRAGGCAACGGVLHAAPFVRKPRGVPSLPPEHDVRLSLCCAREGCRRRVTPASLRFLGRRVYVATVVVIVSVLRHGPSPTRVRRLQELVGVSRRTVERWCRWWRTAFARSAFWHGVSGRFMPAVAAAELPASLLERFRGENEATRVMALLRLVGPITGGASEQAR